MPILERLIVALDVPTYEDASAIVSELGDAVSFYKIGLELLFGGGLRLAQELRDAGKLVFLDMKLLDIGNTVEKAVRNIARLGVNYLTVHAVDGRTMRAAKEGSGASDLKLIGVTVLTSLTPDDLAEHGISESPEELALRRARMAYESGLDGVIASGLEARAIRDAIGSDFTIITPGIRPSGSAANDQARTTTRRTPFLRALITSLSEGRSSAHPTARDRHGHSARNQRVLEPTWDATTWEETFRLIWTRDVTYAAGTAPMTLWATTSAMSAWTISPSQRRTQRRAAGAPALKRAGAEGPPIQLSRPIRRIQADSPALERRTLPRVMPWSVGERSDSCRRLQG